MTEGRAEIGFGQSSGRTQLAHLYQRDPLRVLFPTPAAGDPAIAVIVTASAAEKVYRSTESITTIAQALSVGAGARLEFLPPETILFDGARLLRETVAELAPDGAFLGGDIVVFGRRARGECFTYGFLREVWKVRRAGELVWGDALHLEGDIAHEIDDPACFDGSAAFATMILSPAGRDPRSLLDAARAVQRIAASTALRAGLTAVAGPVIARWLAADAASLRGAYAELASHFRCEALGLPRRVPRLWYV